MEALQREKIRQLVEKDKTIRYIPTGDGRYRVEMKDPQTDPSIDDIVGQIVDIVQ